MISYGVMSEAEEHILGALRREGGELSLAELTGMTHLPSGIVQSIVSHLEEKRSVEIREQPETGLKLIQLRAIHKPVTSFMRRFGFF